MGQRLVVPVVEKNRATKAALFLLGATGNGKTTLTNYLTNSSFKCVTDGPAVLDSCTTELQSAVFPEAPSFTIVDTVGFGDPDKEGQEHELIHELQKEAQKYDAVYFMIVMQYNRNTSIIVKTVSLLRESFGAAALDNLMIWFTSYNAFKHPTLEHFNDALEALADKLQHKWKTIYPTLPRMAAFGSDLPSHGKPGKFGKEMKKKLADVLNLKPIIPIETPIHSALSNPHEKALVYENDLKNWVLQVNLTAQQFLKDEADYLRSAQKNSNYAKVGSNSVSLAGGVVLFTGLCLAPMGVGFPILLIGAAMSGTGGVGTAAACITEHRIKKLRAVALEETVRNYQRACHELLTWLQTKSEHHDKVLQQEQCNTTDHQFSPTSATTVVQQNMELTDIADKPRFKEASGSTPRVALNTARAGEAIVTAGALADSTEFASQMSGNLVGKLAGRTLIGVGIAVDLGLLIRNARHIWQGNESKLADVCINLQQSFEEHKTRLMAAGILPPDEAFLHRKSYEDELDELTTIFMDSLDSDDRSRLEPSFLQNKDLTVVD